MNLPRRPLLALLAVPALSCLEPVAEGPRAFGEGCEITSECASGLSCLEPADYFSASNDAGCVSAMLGTLPFCSVSCQSDADCAESGGACTRLGCAAGQPGVCMKTSGVRLRPLPLDGGLPVTPGARDAGSPEDAADAG